MDPRLIALNRFGLGARTGEKDRIGDPQGWLRAQVDASADVAPASGAPSTEEVGEALVGFRTAQRTRDQERIQDARRSLRDVVGREMRWVVRQRVTSGAPFVERLVAFWSNHLCVSTSNAQVTALSGDYERRVVRRHVLGRFGDMVLASARHPAMLLYLDNARSIGPGSPQARRAGRRGVERGLNENYARELLELHTLGVDGGYTQQDVRALAEILTGWTVSGPGPGGALGGTPEDAVGFAFRPALHEPGAKALLGKRYPEGGVDEGERAIRDLCAHPATARFVAEKLVRHFVADAPPPRAVDELAGVFAESDGDLRAVALALVDVDEAWGAGARKFRTPQDWLVAVLRALDVEEPPPNAPGVLTQLRHRPWAPPAPKGYGDLARDWADPDALMNRGELARTVAQRLGRAVPEPERLLEVVHVAEDDPLPDLLADTTIPRQERLALALAAPAFQWR